MQMKAGIVFLLVLSFFSGCKTIQEDSSNHKNLEQSAGKADKKQHQTYFRTIGNVVPKRNSITPAAPGELETRQVIQQFVKRRTEIRQVMQTSEKLKNDLRRLPGKFRYTEMYQQKAKEIEEHKITEKKELHSYHKELDLLANKYRKFNERTPSGVWKLTEFYNAFAPSARAEDTEYWDTYTANIEEWINQSPDSPTPRIVLANVLIKRAWAHRTTLPARAVKPEAWKAFKYFVSQARSYLEQNKVMTSEDPHWYAAMSIIAMAEGWSLEKFLALMEEGTNRHPYYYQIYFNGMTYLLPRWKGSYAKMEAFANAAVEKTREKDKTGLYARVYWAASGSIKKHRLVADTGVVWEKMRQAMFDVLQKYPDQWNYNNFAYFACMAKDRETTKTLTNHVKTPMRNVWEASEVFDACKNWGNGQDSGLLDMIIGTR